MELTVHLLRVTLFHDEPALRYQKVLLPPFDVEGLLYACCFSCVLVPLRRLAEGMQ